VDVVVASIQTDMQIDQVEIQQACGYPDVVADVDVS
jgi:hypothetical protein